MSHYGQALRKGNGPPKSNGFPHQFPGFRKEQNLQHPHEKEKSFFWKGDCCLRHPSRTERRSGDLDALCQTHGAPGAVLGAEGVTDAWLGRGVWAAEASLQERSPPPPHTHLSCHPPPGLLPQFFASPLHWPLNSRIGRGKLASD